MVKEAKDGSKRRSFFGRTSLGALSAIHNSTKDVEEPASLLRKRRTSSLITNLSAAREDASLDRSATWESPTSPAKPQLSQRVSSSTRPGSVFGSFRSIRLSDDADGSLSDDTRRNRHMLKHGEVQTSNSMFRKKKEYLVLTDTQLIRFKSHQKASETFSA